MEWLNPTAHFLWPIVLAVGAIGIAAHIWLGRDRRRFATEEIVERLSGRTDDQRNRIRSILMTAALILTTIALAGPRFGSTPREVSRTGLDLVIALDVSASMMAEDVAPSRIDRARHELKLMVNQLEGDRVALVTFAGDAFLQMPLTTDRTAFQMFLDVASSDQIPTPGTDFQAMLAVAQQAFAQSEDAADRSRVLLIASDGENHVDGISTIARDLRNSGIEIFTLGIGGREGARIPVRTASGRVEYRTNSGGEVVHTRLEDAMLRSLSGPDGYYEIGRSTNTFTSFPDALDRLQRTEIGAAVFDEYDEWYQWPLGLALILIALEGIVRMRRKDPHAEIG